MRNEIRFISFLILLFLLFSSPLRSKEVKYFGFKNQSIPLLSDFTDLKTLKQFLMNCGFFRKVSVTEKAGVSLVEVVEYPVVRNISFSGLSLFKKWELAELLGIEKGIQFNSRRFKVALETFYRRCKAEGYSHLIVTEIEVKADGRVNLRVNEGLLKSVVVKDGLISEKIIHRFFGELLGRPYNSLKVKKQLEELLYTEGFFSIDSTVKRESGQVVIELVADKKKLNSMTGLIEYSGFSGFKVRSYSSWLTRSKNIIFREYDFNTLLMGNDMLLSLTLSHYGYQRNMAKNYLEVKTSLSYLDFNGENGVLFSIKPDYNINLLKYIYLSAFLKGGVVKGFNQLPNSLFAGFGLGVRFSYQSPLQTFILRSRVEYEQSLIDNYQSIRYRGFLKKDFSFMVFKLTGQINHLNGDKLFFNQEYLNLNREGLLRFADLLDQNRDYIYAEVTSKYFFGLFKIGGFFQGYFTNLEDDIYGLNTYLNIKNIPFNLMLFLHEGRLNIFFKLIFSI